MKIIELNLNETLDVYGAGVMSYLKEHSVVTTLVVVIGVVGIGIFLNSRGKKYHNARWRDGDAEGKLFQVSCAGGCKFETTPQDTRLRFYRDINCRDCFIEICGNDNKSIVQRVTQWISSMFVGNS